MNYVKVRQLTHEELQRAIDTKEGWLFRALHQIPYYDLLGSFYIDEEEEKSDVIGLVRDGYFVDYLVDKAYRKPVEMKTDKDGYIWMNTDYLFEKIETIN